MGSNCAVCLANFYFFSYEFDFLKHLLKNNKCPVVLLSLSLVCRFVGDLFVPDFPDRGSIYPKTSCELNCTSKGFSCNFLDLAVKQSPQGISCDIFDKHSQPEYAGIEMIHMPHVFIPISHLLLSWELSIVNFTGF
jgi:hypothetical protein